MDVKVKKENVCRLCLGTIDEDCIVIDEVFKEMFGVLQLKVEVEPGEDSLICQNCAENTRRCYDFKTVCSATEDLILAFANDVQDEINLEDIYRTTKNLSGDLIEDFGVCRLCMDRTESTDRLNNDEVLAKILPILMPKLGPIIKSPVTCTSCKENLEFYFNTCSRYLHPVLVHQTDVSSTIKQELDLSEEVKIEDVDEAPLTDDLSNYNNLDGHSLTGNDTSDVKPPIQRKRYYKCTLCGYGTRQKHHFEGHLLTHKDASEVEMFRCTNCNYETKYKRCIKRHVQIHDKVLEFKCAICPYETNRRTHFDSHVAKHKRPSDEPYGCQVCGYETTQKHHFQDHLLTHKDTSKVEMYRCTNCNYETKYKRCIKRHVLIHENVPELKCTVCPYKTKRRNHFENHLAKHNQPPEESHRCPTCGYKTNQKHHFQEHLLIHKDSSEVEMFRCDDCTFVTKYKKCLKRHTLVHKKPSEIEMFKCASCDYATKYKKDLRSHMVIHKNPSEVTMYKCAECSYTAKRKDYLRLHKLVHVDVSESDMYRCASCSFKTKHRRYLTKHIALNHRRDSGVDA